jgi:hypothetical protein
MKWNCGLQNYAFNMPNAKESIKFNNNKLISLQMYDTTQSYRTIHRVVKRLSKHILNISHHRRI